VNKEHEVARLDDLQAGELYEVSVAGRSVCLARLGDGSVYAFANLCSHEATALSDGYLDGDEVECPAHGSRFAVRDGSPKCEPAREPIRCFATRVLGGAVIVEIEQEESVGAEPLGAHRADSMH
jgi:nitrite reductase/ring-hydroxylating ferredoxin subunit